MPRPVQAILTTASATFPPETAPANFVFTLEDGTSEPISVPYPAPSPIRVTFPAVPEGEWVCSASLQTSEGTIIGRRVSGTVTVPADDVAGQEPLSLALALG